MKSNKVKFFAIFFAVFLLVIGGGIYYASTKLNPEEIKKIVLIQTQKIFPNAQVNLDKVNIGWGLNFKVELENFELTTTGDNNEKVELAKLHNFVVKIPLWSILTDGGIVEIQLDKPLVNYAEFKQDHNWAKAMNASAEASSTEAAVEQNEAEASEPSPAVLGLLAKSKINVKVSDVAIKYSLRNNSAGEITVSRFLVKGLNLESATAFEIASDAKFALEDKSEVSFSTLAIGEVNISDMVKNGSVNSLVIVKLNNIKKTGLDMKFPEITTNLNVLLKKSGEISGKVETSFETHNKISANFLVTKEIILSDINVDIILKDVGAIIGLDRSIDLSKAKLLAGGSVHLSEEKKIDANLNFTVSPGIGFSVDGINTATTAKGTFKRKDISLSAKTEVLSGAVDVAVNGEFDPNQEFDLKKLKPFDIKVTANKLNIPEKFIQDKLWGKKPVPAAATAPSAAKEGPATTPLILPPGTVHLAWSNILVGGENFQGKSKIVISQTALAIDNLDFVFSKGTGSLTQTLKFGTVAHNSVFNFNIKDLNLSSFKPFLPPFVENFTGTFSGKVNGTATLPTNPEKAPGFDVNVDVAARNGEIKKLNLKEYILPIVQGIPVVKDQVTDKDVNVDGNFETLSLKGRFTDALYTLNTFKFVGINKKVEINGSGAIYPVVQKGKNSAVEVTLSENGKIGAILQKNIGTKIIPIKVEGPGFEMKPDIEYTVGRVAKAAAQTKGVEAVQKVIDKNLDKVVPEKAREQVKGLIDGLFKKKK